MSKEEKIKQIIDLSQFVDSMIKISLTAVNCGGEYARRHPLDYATVVSIYQEEVENLLFKAFDKCIESEEMADKIIAMHNSEEFKTFTSIAQYIVDFGDGMSVSIEAAKNSRMPVSFAIYNKSKVLERLATRNNLQKRPENEVAEIMKAMEELMHIDSIPKGDCDCENCDAEDCTNRDKPPKGSLMN